MLAGNSQFFANISDFDAWQTTNSPSVNKYRIHILSLEEAAAIIHKQITICCQT